MRPKTRGQTETCGGVSSCLAPLSTDKHWHCRCYPGPASSIRSNRGCGISPILQGPPSSAGSVHSLVRGVCSAPALATESVGSSESASWRGVTRRLVCTWEPSHKRSLSSLLSGASHKGPSLRLSFLRKPAAPLITFPLSSIRKAFPQPKHLFFPHSPPLSPRGEF